MATTKAFNSYEIQIAGGNEGRVALVMCYQGSSFVGRIDFHPDGLELSSDYLWHPANPTVTYVVLKMPVSRFADVVATLRQEKPLQLHINVDAGVSAATNGHGCLKTGAREPVGEFTG
jgi:hypothetical protein